MARKINGLDFSTKERVWKGARVIAPFSNGHVYATQAVNGKTTKILDVDFQKNPSRRLLITAAYLSAPSTAEDAWTWKVDGKHVLGDERIHHGVGVSAKEPRVFDPIFSVLPMMCENMQVLYKATGGNVTPEVMIEGLILEDPTSASE